TYSSLLARYCWYYAFTDAHWRRIRIGVISEFLPPGLVNVVTGRSAAPLMTEEQFCPVIPIATYHASGSRKSMNYGYTRARRQGIVPGGRFRERARRRPLDRDRAVQPRGNGRDRRALSAPAPSRPPPARSRHRRSGTGGRSGRG